MIHSIEKIVKEEIPHPHLAPRPAALASIEYRTHRQTRQNPAGVTGSFGRYSFTMKSRNGYTLVELLVVIIVVGILAAVMIPMMQGRVDSAKWSEGRAIMGTIARALRAHIAEKGAGFTPVPTLEELGMAPGDMGGTYFAGGESGAGDFSWVITGSNPPSFLVTATAPAGVDTPSQITLDRAGTFTETP